MTHGLRNLALHCSPSSSWVSAEFSHFPSLESVCSVPSVLITSTVLCATVYSNLLEASHFKSFKSFLTYSC
jgi:hypothetical protein